MPIPSMTPQPDSNNCATPRWAALLLLAYGAHVGEDSPGTVTGALVYLPLGGLVLRHMSHTLPGPVFSRAIAAGMVAHALVAIAAFT